MRKQKLIEVTFTLRLKDAWIHKQISTHSCDDRRVWGWKVELRRSEIAILPSASSQQWNCLEVKRRRFAGHWVITSLKHVFKLRQFDVIGALWKVKLLFHLRFHHCKRSFSLIFVLANFVDYWKWKYHFGRLDLAMRFWCLKESEIQLKPKCRWKQINE